MCLLDKTKPIPKGLLVKRKIKDQLCKECGRPMWIYIYTHTFEFSTTAHANSDCRHNHTNISPFDFAREKVDTLASKMEDIAKAVIRVLHDNVKNPKASAEPREAAPSILRLALYSSDTSSTCWNELDSTTAPNSHALSVHLCGQDRRICLRRSLGGSTVSTLPAGCMLVTVGKQIQVTS